ncbi:hypothetical protein BSKO_00839 [Bryopsis sp. KO-2023]|nr:hypothetical protein BSKO_00839 [Bryopsis sp. KO-2023]
MLQGCGDFLASGWAFCAKKASSFAFSRRPCAYRWLIYTALAQPNILLFSTAAGLTDENATRRLLAQGAGDSTGVGSKIPFEAIAAIGVVLGVCLLLGALTYLFIWGMSGRKKRRDDDVEGSRSSEKKSIGLSSDDDGLVMTMRLPSPLTIYDEKTLREKMGLADTPSKAHSAPQTPRVHFSTLGEGRGLDGEGDETMVEMFEVRRSDSFDAAIRSLPRTQIDCPGEGLQPQIALFRGSGSEESVESEDGARNPVYRTETASSQHSLDSPRYYQGTYKPAVDIAPIRRSHQREGGFLNPLFIREEELPTRNVPHAAAATDRGGSSAATSEMPSLTGIMSPMQKKSVSFRREGIGRKRYPSSSEDGQE